MANAQTNEKPRRGGGCLRNILIGVVVLVVIVVIIVALSGGEQQSTSTGEQTSSTSANSIQDSNSEPATNAEQSDTAETQAEATATPEPTATPAPIVGQDVVVAEVRWKILEAVDAGQEMDTPLGKKATAGRFIRLRFEVENLGKEQQNFGGISLVDTKGRVFESSSDLYVLTVIPEEEQCTLLEPLVANLPKTCQLIYEVPTSAAGLQAKVGDLELFGSQEAVIALDLPDPTSVTPESALASLVELAEGQTGSIGQDIKVGEVRWKVLEAKDEGQSVQTPTGEKATQGKFVRVRVEVENLSSTQANFSDLEIVDTQNRSFKTASTDFDLLTAIPDAEQCALLEQLPANLPKTCQVLFELPADAQGLKLKLGDLSLLGANEALVDLGF